MAGLTDLFADTVRETSETALGGKNGYRNLVQQAHYTSNFLVGGKTDEEMLHTGQTIRDTLYLKSENVGKRFGGAGLRFDYDNKQVGTKVTTQMSFYATYLAWDEVELDLNADSSMGKEYIRAKFNDILKGKYQNLTQTQADQFEGEFWAAADQSAMRTNFTAPMSIPYYITEQDSGLPCQGGELASMTDVLGLSPATYSKWKNQRVKYSAYGGDAETGADLIGSLIYAAQISHFEPLPFNPEDGVMESVPNVVFCSDTGLRVVTAALRAGQDTWGSRELSHMGVTLDNMIFRNITTLNTAALYSDNATSSDAAASLFAEDSASAHANGPRYYGVSKKYMNPMFMRDRYMKAGDVTDLTAVGKPNEYVQVFKTYNQLVCCDRSKGFIVYPDASIA
jgi:hypothetical protein